MLRLVREAEPIGTPEDHTLALNTHLIRRFLGMPDDEVTELTAFIWNRPLVAHARDADDHCRLLREVESRDGFCGSYMLHAPINPQVLYRYEPGSWTAPHNGRVSDKETTARRAFYVEIDTVRVKNISATDDEKRAAWEVAQRVQKFLVSVVGETAIGFGDSGNGYYMLIALEPSEPTAEQARKASRFLQLLDAEFTTDRAKVDKSVFNVARLMPAPGTTKGKGRNASERPHRVTSFSCRGTITRVPFEVLCG